MSETSSPSPKLLASDRRAFLLRKLHSLSGVAPIGAFLVFHLWENATALHGKERFNESVADINKMPYLAVLEWGIILLPLLFHAGYGIKLTLASRPNLGQYPFNRNWMYTLQRVTGLLALAYICFHLHEYWWQRVTGALAPEQLYSALSRNLSSAVGPVPVVALVYILGIAACAFHFANGLWGFCFSWGITVSRRSQRMAAAVFGVLGVLLFALGANTVIHFATGASLLGSG